MLVKSRVIWNHETKAGFVSLPVQRDYVVSRCVCFRVRTFTVRTLSIHAWGCTWSVSPYQLRLMNSIHTFLDRMMMLICISWPLVLPETLTAETTRAYTDVKITQKITAILCTSWLIFFVIQTVKSVCFASQWWSSYFMNKPLHYPTLQTIGPLSGNLT